MTKALYAEFTALDVAAADRAEEILLRLADAVRREPGNLAFDAYRKTDDVLTFFVYEIYADEEAFHAHLGREHSRVFNAELTNLVIGGGSTLTWLTPLGS
jgi:quinol monooxygenase YgiN